MALVESTMLPLGTPLPSFELEDTVSGAQLSPADFEGQALVVAVICNHCPYVKHIARSIVAVGNWLRQREVGMVAVSANDPTAQPDDDPKAMGRVARELAFPFPYLFDEKQVFARALGAVCTPEFYVFDFNHHLVYRGQLDEARPGNGAISDGHDIKEAVRRLHQGEPPIELQKPSIGCSIKWTPRS